MDFLFQVSELNGYLKLLQRFCKKRCDFDASALTVEGDLEGAVERYVSNLDDIVEYRGLNKISFSDFQNIMKRFVYSNLTIQDENMVRLIDWDIVEYFGVASTVMDPEGDFNPIVSNGGWELDVTSNFYEACTVVLVQYDEQALILSFGVR